MGGVKQYEVQYEPVDWWRLDKRFNLVFHPSDTGSVSCFTRVFAPAKIDTDIFHVWSYKDAGGNWQERVFNFSVFYADFGKQWIKDSYQKMNVQKSELIILVI